MSRSFPVGQEFYIVMSDDDVVYSMNGVLVSESIRLESNGNVIVGMTFIGNDGSIMSSDSFSKEVIEKRNSKSWHCNYCNSINSIEERYCGEFSSYGCGAGRPFILE